MPRRGTETIQPSEVPKKKICKTTEEELPTMDISFCDDEGLAPGVIFTDVQQKKWKIGKPVGRGSFGRIYLASDQIDMEVTKLNARYVVKIEPHTNGPLFVEIHCLIRTTTISKVQNWRVNHKGNCLGMPMYIASGSFVDENTGVKYRFLVLPRYDIDLQKIINKTKVLDMKNVLVLAVQILDVLEFLHNQGYTHSDIKSSNLMLGFDGSKFNKITKIRPPSFQKDTKEVAVLSGKHRRPKSTKSKASNYYDDEDFIVRDSRNGLLFDGTECDVKLANVKNKLRKILSDRHNRTLHRHHAFNLRQLSSYVNYEDMTSSVCSDQSYQRLLDDFENKPFSQNKLHEDLENPGPENLDHIVSFDEIQKEAIFCQCSGQIYLLDYGLASKFLDSEGKHKDFGMDARKAHDGTLEYSSRDSHIGAHSRRSDLETLGYNILDWLTGSLPWKTTEVLAEPDLVHALKKNFMNDIKSLLKACFKSGFYPQFIQKYLEYITTLDFTDRPDYEYCRNLFRNEWLKSGYDKDISLNFAEAIISSTNYNKSCYSRRFGRKNTPPDFIPRNGVSKSYERENITCFESDLKLELLKQTLNTSSDGFRRPCTSRNFFISDADLVARLKKSLMHNDFGKKLSPKNLRSKKKRVEKKRSKRTHRNSIGKFGNFMGSAKQFTWAEILAQNPEDIIRKERNVNTCSYEEAYDEETCKYRIRKLSETSSDNNDANLHSPLLQKDYLQGLNPTYAMKEVIANLKKKISNKTNKDNYETGTVLEGYTPAMMKWYRIKEKRELKEKNETIKQQNADNVTLETPRRSTRAMKRTASKNKMDSKITRQKACVVVIEKSDKLDNEINKAVKGRKKFDKIELTNGEKTTKNLKMPKDNANKKPKKSNADNVPKKMNLRSSEHQVLRNNKVLHKNR